MSWRYSPAVIRWELGAENRLFHPILTMAQKSQKSNPRLGHTRAEAKQPTGYPSITNSLEALINLVSPESLASCRHGVTTSGQDAKIGKFGLLRRPTRICFRGDLVKPSLDPRPLISALVRCIGFWLAVTLAACCSPRAIGQMSILPRHLILFSALLVGICFVQPIGKWHETDPVPNLPNQLNRSGIFLFSI